MITGKQSQKTDNSFLKKAEEKKKKKKEKKKTHTSRNFKKEKWFA
jgi:hypothetical protein